MHAAGTAMAEAVPGRHGAPSFARGWRLSVATTLVAAICALTVPAAARAHRPRVVALGDSLTSGRGIGQGLAYPAVLQDRLRENGYDYEVVNAGVSGDT